MHIRAKKSLGQHFLTDKNLAVKIVGLLKAEAAGQVVEVGPGTGVLTGLLSERFGTRYHAVEIDRESVEYLKQAFPGLADRIHLADFLNIDLAQAFEGDIHIIGNFPYNISSQILFRVLRYRSRVKEVVGMFQREVARRIVTGPGSKEYGILSVLLGAFYDMEYQFTVSEKVFSPQPKVKSAVISLERNKVERLGCDEDLFFRIVKMGFNQRRKTLRNSLSDLINTESRPNPMFNFRPEQLSVQGFLELTDLIANQGSNTLEVV